MQYLSNNDIELLKRYLNIEDTNDLWILSKKWTMSKDINEMTNSELQEYTKGKQYFPLQDVFVPLILAIITL